MLDAKGDLFIDKVFFFRSSIFSTIFLGDASWLGSFGLPFIFFSPILFCLGHMKLWGGVGIVR
jgi:hypothetical protein